MWGALFESDPEQASNNIHVANLLHDTPYFQKTSP